MNGHSSRSGLRARAPIAADMPSHVSSGPGWTTGAEIGLLEDPDPVRDEPVRVFGSLSRAQESHAAITRMASASLLGRSARARVAHRSPQRLLVRGGGVLTLLVALLAIGGVVVRCAAGGLETTPYHWPP